MITEKLVEKIRKINSLIKDLDKDYEKSNSYSLKSMKEHVKEIEELFLKNDEHWKAEIIDLLIHCLLMLERNHCQQEEMKELLNIRFRKFEEKILKQLNPVRNNSTY